MIIIVAPDEPPPAFARASATRLAASPARFAVCVSALSFSSPAMFAICVVLSMRRSGACARGGSTVGSAGSAGAARSGRDAGRGWLRGGSTIVASG